MIRKTSSSKVILDDQYPRTLTGRQLDEVAFPLGGIGTGMISLGGWGHLREWEIANRPARNFANSGSFFAVKIRRKGRPSVTRVLQGPAGGSFAEGTGIPLGACGEALPHFRKSAFTGSYPFARVSLEDPAVPLNVTLTAFNPFIPLNDKDSSIPVAILIYRFENPVCERVSGTIFASMRNLAGHPDADGRVNFTRRSEGLTGLFATATKFRNDSPRYGDMTLSVACEQARVWNAWTDDNLLRYWQVISGDAPFPPGDGSVPVGTVAADFSIGPGRSADIPFFITWFFPVYQHGYSYPRRNDGMTYHATWRNCYATFWKDSWDVACYVHRNFQRLHRETRQFHDTLFASTLPGCVLDAVSSQMAVLKSTTCLRLEDGTFYGFEGSGNEEGCCHGSCTHVWNYAQTQAYLFPALQRSMHDAQYRHSMRADGMCCFRLPLPPGRQPDWPSTMPCADGQMGEVIQVYREWLISGDDTWLKSVWPLAKRSLEFAWKFWDPDRDGVMEGVQHNTWDIEFWRPNTMVGSLYLAALLAGERIARHLGDTRTAETYRAVFLKGSAWTDRHLFNGSYYEQKVNPDASALLPENLRKIAEEWGKDSAFPWPKWQFGRGCIADQLIGQWYARMLGLGYLYRKENVRKALRSLFQHNWIPDFTDYPHTHPYYVMNDEAGLVGATWPRGGRPGNPFYFGDTVYTGSEYQVAGHMIYEGFIEEALTIVTAIRNRYTGERRNPWDESECGRYYARAMANYGLLLALSGFSYSAPERAIGFSPALRSEDFRCFFCVGSGWGLYSQKQGRGRSDFRLEVRCGSLTLETILLPAPQGGRSVVTLGHRGLPAFAEKRGQSIAVRLDRPVTIEKGQTLRISFGKPPSQSSPQTQ